MNWNFPLPWLVELQDGMDLTVPVVMKTSPLSILLSLDWRTSSTPTLVVDGLTSLDAEPLEGDSPC